MKIKQMRMSRRQASRSQLSRKLSNYKNNQKSSWTRKLNKIIVDTIIFALFYIYMLSINDIMNAFSFIDFIFCLSTVIMLNVWA